jgi:hypothetical protein
MCLCSWTNTQALFSNCVNSGGLIVSGSDDVREVTYRSFHEPSAIPHFIKVLDDNFGSAVAIPKSGALNVAEKTLSLDDLGTKYQPLDAILKQDEENCKLVLKSLWVITHL